MILVLVNKTHKYRNMLPKSLGQKELIFGDIALIVLYIVIQERSFKSKKSNCLY